MNFLQICSFIIIIVGVNLLGFLLLIIIRFIIRSYFTEKRRHLSIMMHVEEPLHNLDLINETATEDGTVTWKSEKEKKEK